MKQTSSRLPIFIAVLISASFAGTVFAQAVSPVITKSFTPAAVALNGNSIATITVTNPNATLALTNVQFSDTMPAVPWRRCRMTTPVGTPATAC